MLAKIRPYFPIFLLTAGHGAVDSYLVLLTVLAPAVSAALAIPLGDVVVLMGVTGLVNNLTQPLAGHIMGKRNLAWVLWFAIALSSLPVFMGYAWNFWSLAAISILGGVGTGLYHPEGVLAAHDEAGDKAYLGVPLFMAGGAAITAIATPLSIRVTEAFGLRGMVWFLLPGLLLSAIFYVRHREKALAHPSVIIRPRSKRMTRSHAGNVAFPPLLATGICLCVANGLFLAILSSHYELTFGSDALIWSGWVLTAMGVGASVSSFLWSALAKRRGFYLLVFLTQLVAAPLFLMMASPASPQWGFLFALPLSMVSPAAIHPVGVVLSRGAAGLTQGMRASLMIGGTYAVTSLVVMLAGVLLRRGVPSDRIVLIAAGCSLLAMILALWQLAAARRSGSIGDRGF